MAADGGTCVPLPVTPVVCVGPCPGTYQPRHTLLCMHEEAISDVSGEEVSGMTITPRVLPGACRVPSAPVLRTSTHRLSAVHGRAVGPCRSMAAGYQTAMDLIPAIFTA